jgi:hypothetical protein
MEILYGEFLFVTDDSDPFKVHVSLMLAANPVEVLWECGLDALWEDDSVRPTPDLRRVWDMHSEGDYYQQTLQRHNRELHPHLSYTAVFHEMIRNNRTNLKFIRNIYSTSSLDWLSMGYRIYPLALQFWQIQEQGGYATYVVDEQRYRAVL